MAPRVQIPRQEDLTGEVAQLADEVRQLGADNTTIRMLSYRADLVPAFQKFYMMLRADGLVEGRLKELVRLRVAELNRCSF